MDSSRILAKAFLAFALACAVAVIILFNIAGAGLLARLLVYTFLAGLFTSGIAAALSFRPGSARVLQHMCVAALGAYTLTAVSAVLWILVAKPAFG